MRWSPTNDLAGCCAATAVRPDGQTHREHRSPDLDLGHRCVRSAPTRTTNSVTDGIGTANSAGNSVGPTSGHDAVEAAVVHGGSRDRGGRVEHRLFGKRAETTQPASSQSSAAEHDANRGREHYSGGVGRRITDEPLPLEHDTGEGRSQRDRQVDAGEAVKVSGDER
jgi:hypothetical protein